MPRTIDIPQEVPEASDSKSEKLLSIKQARSVAVGYISELRLSEQYHEDQPQMREALFELVERICQQERQVGNPDDFHNFAVLLGGAGYDSLACDILEKGLSLFPSDVDLLADYLIYGIDCERLEPCKKYYDMLQKLPQSEWTWRGFAFSIVYLRRLQSILPPSEEREICKKKISEIARAYKKNLPQEEGAYREYARLYDRNPDKELSLLQEALDNGQIGACPSCAFRCADLLFVQKQYQNALAAINRSLEDAVNQKQGGINEFYLYFLSALCKLGILLRKNEYSEEDILEIYSDFNIALIGVSSEYIDTIRTRVRILEQKTGIHVSDQYERLQEVIGY
ncbi:MAG: hypothetical protein ACLU6B_09155 [Lachnospirales bacterium]